MLIDRFLHAFGELLTSFGQENSLKAKKGHSKIHGKHWKTLVKFSQRLREFVV